MRRKRLNWRPNLPVTPEIPRVTRHKRFRRHAFLSRMARAEATRRRQCLQFAATCLKFAARLRELRQSAGHPPQALQPTPIFFAIRSWHLDFAASNAP
jgi:hypothetical protein